jgi:hypothetical protein
MSETILRWIGGGGCCFILGMNVAFLIHSLSTLWKLFIIGKGLLTLYIGLDIWYDEWHWTVVIAFVGIVLTSVSQARAWYLDVNLFDRGESGLSKT